MVNTKQKLNTRFSGSALITGASKGIGRALAIECAKRGFNLALVSLPDSGLIPVVKYITKHYPVKVKFLEIDLSLPKAPMKIYQWTSQESINVQLLINNAGLGHLGSFSEYSYEFYEKIIRLNIESVVLLTKLFLPELKKHDKAYILNLGSLASFYPIPFKIVYAGSKSFIYSFSRALKSEMKKSPVNVSVLCPGPIITSPEVIERIKQGGFWGRSSSMRAQKMARIALNGLFKEKAVIIPGTINKCLRLVNNLIPVALKQKVLAKKFNVNGNLVTQNDLKISEKEAQIEQ
jgi:short-subunit dehydrogenase